VARFFLITINYAPEPSGFAPHATQLAEYLAGQGHQVSVFTGFAFAPAWHRREEDRGRLSAKERIAGVTVHRVTHVIPRRPSSVLQRIAMEGSFSAAAFVAILVAIARGAGRPDAVVYIGAQPAAAMLARVVGAITGRPYFVRITDLAAQAALDVGMVGSRLSRALEAFEFAAYRKAAGASVLCGSFADALVAHRYPAHRIHVLHNPIDTDRVRPMPRSGAFRAQYGIPDAAFVLLHAGSMGRKQALMDVLSAAALTRDAGLCWVLVGDGEARRDLVERARARGVEDVVRFVPFQPEDGLSAMFADADVLLVSQIAAVKDTLIPGKLLTYMAAGRPVLAAVNADSQAAQLLREAEGGLLVAPEDAHALAAGARRLATSDRATRDAFGARNRAYAEEHFDERKILAAHERLILQSMRAACAGTSRT